MPKYQVLYPDPHSGPVVILQVKLLGPTIGLFSTRSKGKKKGKGKGNYLTSVAKQAKTAFLHGPTVWKSPIVGIEPATFRSESAALTTAPRDPE